METQTKKIKEIDLEKPILIEGLPGVGHIGKLATEHLIDELGAEKYAEIYSPHLPPQVLIDEDNKTNLVRIELYYVEHENNNFIFVVGDHQSTDNVGHFEIVKEILETVEENDVERIFTIGGFATGEMVDSPEIYGAVNDVSLIDELKEVDVEFDEEKPEGGIVGASGLLLGLSERKGIKAACLMGETSGYIVDPVSAQLILRKLSKLLEFEIDLQELEDRAEEIEDLAQKIKQKKQAQQQGQAPQPSGEDLRYIG
ncbi:proteasome assembly chaperone family protein [archaeon SCG-AAA382B04]|nr:proteasome assembly chaperone family protein [archaeon SCG-AAA382B04]